MKRFICCLFLPSLLLFGCSEESDKNAGPENDASQPDEASSNPGSSAKTSEEGKTPEESKDPETGTDIKDPVDSAQTDPDPAQTDPDPAQTDPDPAQTDPDPAQTDPDPAQTDPDPGQTDPAPVDPQPSDPGVCAGTVCSGVCVDLNTNNSHCGGCGFACGTGLHCENMNCACDDKALTKCGYNNCVNLQTDPNNCGTCQNVCASGKCTNGSCDGSAPVTDPGAGEITGEGKHVIEYARQFLFSKVNMCTYDLKLNNLMSNLIDLFDVGEDINYGYDNNCANFVSTVLIDTNELTDDDFNEYINGTKKRHFREGVDAIKWICDNHIKGYHALSDPRQAQAGDIWYLIGTVDGKHYSHTELIEKVEGDQFWQIGSNDYTESETIGCLRTRSLPEGKSYSTNPKDYQRVTEHTRPISFGDGQGVVCSKR